MHHLVKQYHTLANKQIALGEGLTLLRGIQTDLNRSMASADAWGMTAVVANAALIPLNVIINAFELKKANTIYQSLVRKAYDTFSKSGTRSEGNAKVVLGMLKKVIVEELVRQGLTDYVPGVNIIAGLAEDSLAFWQTLGTVDTGSREMRVQAANLHNKIAALQRELIGLGVLRAQLHERMQTIARTA